MNASGLVQQISNRSTAYNATGNSDRIVTLSTDFLLETAAANNIGTVIGYGSTPGFQHQLVVLSNRVLAIGNMGGFMNGPAITTGV